MPDNSVNPEIAQQLGLSKKEFEQIKKHLNRDPNFIELCLFAALWAERKQNPVDFIKSKVQSSANWQIKNVPWNPLQSLIELNEKLNCFAWIESNNHFDSDMSFNEAANCLAISGKKAIASSSVPIACLNTFRFGLPEMGNTKNIAEEFLKGIGEIGNSSGYPLVGAKINFERCFADNPEINTMIIGTVDNSKFVIDSKTAQTKKIFIIGSKIRGGNFISEKIRSIDDIDSIRNLGILDSKSGLSEKILHESTLELIDKQIVRGIYAVEKNGLLNVLVEICLGHKCGLRINFEKIHNSEKSDLVVRYLLSPQFARLILVIDEGKEEEVSELYLKWGIKILEIGQLTESGDIQVVSKSAVLVNIPVDYLFSGIEEIKCVDKCQATTNIEPDKKSLEVPMPQKLKDVAWFLIKHPNIASKRWINEQYDSMAGIGNMSTNFISDSILINLKGTNQALAMCMTGNQKHLKANASIGAQIAVASAIRKIASTGAKPSAIVPLINFVNRNSQRDCEIFNDYAEGIRIASEKFKLPVVNENIKLNNRTDEKDILHCPSLTIGAIGLLEDKNQQMTISFKDKGNIIFLIGPSYEEISASEYEVSYHKKSPVRPPFFDLDLEIRVYKAIQELIQKKFVCSVHNVSRGGLFISLVESAMIFGYGFDIITDTDIRLDAFLFGESQGRVLVSINPNKEAQFIDLMMKKEIPFLALGHVTKGEMRVDDISFGFIEDVRKAYENALENLIEK